MAGSPRFIYRGLTVVELQAIRAAALDRITNGTFTQLSGAQKNSTVEYLDPADMLFEANASLGALGVAGFIPGPSTTYADFSGLREMPNTVQE